MKYGYSIGAFDADKFVGDILTLGIGREGEPYEGIGRGMINIAGLPVYRDAIGGVGTPTSDNERTKVSLETTNLLVLLMVMMVMKPWLRLQLSLSSILFNAFVSQQNTLMLFISNVDCSFLIKMNI